MSNIASLLFYLMSFSFAAFLMYYGTKRKLKILVWISLVVPILIASLRYGVGTDYFSYTEIYKVVSQLSLSDFLSSDKTTHELGFFALVKLSSYLSHGYALLFAMSSILTVVFYYLGLNKYQPKHKALAYFLYLTVIFPLTLNTMRQGIAMSICFFAFTFMISKNAKKFILWILIASLFHTSALVLLPFYFLNKVIKPGDDKSNYATFIKIFLVSLAVLMVLPYFSDVLSTITLFDKYTKYQDIVANGNNYTFYLKALILGILLFFYRRILAVDKNNAYFLAFAMIDVAMSTLGFTSSIFNRITLYFIFFNLLLLTSIIDIFKDRLGKFISTTSLILFGYLYFLLSNYVLGQAHVIPYTFLIGSH